MLQYTLNFFMNVILTTCSQHNYVLHILAQKLTVITESRQHFVQSPVQMLKCSPRW